MIRRLARPSSVAVLAITVGVATVAAACGGSAAAPTAASTIAPTSTPLPTARPTPRPTPTPSPRPSLASPTPAATDAATSLRIAAPYTLTANASNQQMSGSMSFNIGSAHLTETISGREIRASGKLVGMALVLRIAGVPMSDALFEGGAKGAANQTGGKLSYTTVLGTRVALVSAPSVTAALYRLHDDIVMVIGVKAADTKTLLEAVIKANK